MTKARVRPLKEEDLSTADLIFRLAFGTFLGLSEPTRFAGDSDYVRTRWRADPAASFAVEAEGKVVGSNFVTTWGSVGFFGPLSVRPDLWNQGLAQRLLEPTMELFAQRQVRHAGLFTFPHSPKHIALYQKFGFWPRFLTAIMARSVRQEIPLPREARYSEIAQQGSCLEACRELTHTAYEGLDLEREIRAVATQGWEKPSFFGRAPDWRVWPCAI